MRWGFSIQSFRFPLRKTGYDPSKENMNTKFSTRYGFSCLSSFTLLLYVKLFELLRSFDERGGKVKFSLNHTIVIIIRLSNILKLDQQFIYFNAKRKSGLNIKWNRKLDARTKEYSHKLECKQIYEIKEKKCERLLRLFERFFPRLFFSEVREDLRLTQNQKLFHFMDTK